MRAIVRLVAVLMGVMGAAATGVAAESSELRRFEESIQPAPRESHQAVKEPAHDGEDEDIGTEIVEALLEGLMDGVASLFAEGGRASLQSLDPETDVQIHRSTGKPLIPFLRYDFGYQRVSANISAHINRFEGGYGPVAVLLENSKFNERSPATTLKIDRVMFLYRMSNGQAEFDFGLGHSAVTGARYTEGGILSLRARFEVSDGFSIDGLSAWGNGMDDYEAALHWGIQYGSLKAGYRILRASGASLDGPFVGVAFYL